MGGKKTLSENRMVGIDGLFFPLLILFRTIFLHYVISVFIHFKPRTLGFKIDLKEKIIISVKFSWEYRNVSALLLS